MWYADCVEVNPENHISYELAEKFAERFLELGTFYVWKDENNIYKKVIKIERNVVF